MQYCATTMLFVTKAPKLEKGSWLTLKKWKMIKKVGPIIKNNNLKVKFAGFNFKLPKMHDVLTYIKRNVTDNIFHIFIHH